MSRNKKSLLLTDDQNSQAWDLVGKHTECYVTAVVSKFQVKPKFNFPENEPTVLCALLDIKTNKFLMRLCCIQQKKLLFEQEISDKLNMKRKNNMIILDASVGKIKFDFQSTEETEDVFNLANNIIKMKKLSKEKAELAEKQKKKSKKGKKSKITTLEISTPIGFRHLNLIQKKIVDQLPDHLKRSEKSQEIIKNFFLENDVSNIVEEDVPVKQTDQSSALPVRPVRRPPPVIVDSINSGPPRPSRPPPLPQPNSEVHAEDIIIPGPPPAPVNAGPPPPPPPVFAVPGPPPPPMPVDSTQPSGAIGLSEISQKQLRKAEDRPIVKVETVADEMKRVLEKRLKAMLMDEVEPEVEETFSDAEEMFYDRRASFEDPLAT